MLTIGHLIKELKTHGVIIDRQTIHRYCRGYWEPVPGQKKYFSFYPHTLPFTENARGWYCFDYDTVYAWLKKYKSAYFFAEKRGIYAFNEERRKSVEVNEKNVWWKKGGISFLRLQERWKN